MDRNLSPYAEAGSALSSREFITVRLGYGAEFHVGSGPSTRRLFVQHAALRKHPFLIGMRFAR